MSVVRRWLPIVAVATFVLFIGAIIATAGDTLGYDYQAYLGAAKRLLDGQALYDANVAVAGPFAIYLYPPPFAVAFLPFAIAPPDAALAAWIGLSILCLVAGIALLPVRAEIRWLILLLAALDWPVAYSIKLGQVGPLLFLLFAAGWRWLERPLVLGVTMGLGAIVKIQPALLIVWAFLTGRRRAAGVAILIVIGAGLLSTALVGIDAWGTYVALLTRVSSPVTTPHNMTLGAVLYRSGWDAQTAGLVQLAWVAIALAAAGYATIRRPAEVGYLVTVVATQAISPLLWDHYAMLLLLPVAWLLARGQWWAIVIPLATSLPLVRITPEIVYPIVFAACLIAPILVTGRVDRAIGAASRGPAGSAA